MFGGAVANPTRAACHPKYRPTTGDGCVLWFPGQDDPQSVTIRDRSGNANHGTISGATWVKTASGLYVLNFDGNDDYIDLGTPASLSFTSSFTVMGWMYYGDTNTNYLISKDGAAGNRGWYFGFQSGASAGKLRLLVSSDGTSVMYRNLDSALTMSTFYHIAGVYNAVAQTLAIYVNGAEPASTLTGVVPATINNSSANVYIARLTTSYALAQIGLVRAYNVVLSTSDIASRYAQERALFGI